MSIARVCRCLTLLLLSCVDEQYTYLCLRCQCHHVVHDLTDGVGWAVEGDFILRGIGRIFGEVAAEIMATCLAACTGLRHKGGIRMDA
eukprot:6883998-Ditylum_brightwellii.AAC.1